jgi:hypothetical protein
MTDLEAHVARVEEAVRRLTFVALTPGNTDAEFVIAALDAAPEPPGKMAHEMSPAEFQRAYMGTWPAPEPERVTPDPVDSTGDIVSYIFRQREWSERTFGEGRRTLGVTRHIERELAEIRADPSDLMEWVDVVILAMDGAWRAGYTPTQIMEAMEEKQATNFAREWPAPGPEDEPTEHVRAAPEPVADGELPEAVRDAVDVVRAYAAARGLETEAWHRMNKRANALEAHARAQAAELARLRALAGDA